MNDRPREIYVTNWVPSKGDRRPPGNTTAYDEYLVVKPTTPKTASKGEG